MTRGSAALLASILIVAAVLTPRPAQAERYHVLPAGTRTSQPSIPGDWSPANCYPTLAAALAEASAADSVLCSPDEHAVAAALTVAVALLGNAALSPAPQGARLDLGDTGSLIVAAGLPALRLQGLTVTGGGDQRQPVALATTAAGTEIVLVGCWFRDLAAVGAGFVGGAALRLPFAGVLTAVNCEFTGNRSTGRGGAVFLGAGLTVEFDACVFSANVIEGSDPRGGAVMIDARQQLSAATFRGCTFSDNTSGGPGGAVSTLSAAVLFEDCEIRGSRGGVANGWSEGAGLHFRRNSTDHTQACPVTVRRCDFTDNRGVPDVQLDAGDGGAIHTSGATGGRMVPVLVEDCVFRENFNLQGAGVYVSRYSEGTVRRCRFFDNVAYFHAGGVFKGGPFQENLGETLWIDTCLFIRNLAGYDDQGQPANSYCRGGAIVCRMFPRVVVRHSTFVDNRIFNSSYRFGDAFAHYHEYGDWHPDMLCVLQNCVFWGTSGVHVQVYSSSGGMAAADHCAAAAGQMNLGGLVPVSPVVLAESPYESLLTGYPLDGGPLIDAGLEIGFTLDLDMRPMPAGDGPEIGCFERPDPTGVTDVPAAGSRLTAGPNPFNPRTELLARLERASQVRLDLYDTRGRLVRVLWQGPLVAGDHRWLWNGRDAGGRECAAGVYAARLVLDGRHAATCKLTLVR
ncbi:MAG: right-handed parallel beta-helix repeat-containing protein [Candidatus Krumholzibacteria bacterium]|nr:right-handed parallel beta-helix repeat-containing protein [Candidatus Krumholzibacteria bacterium]